MFFFRGGGGDVYDEFAENGRTILYLPTSEQNLPIKYSSMGKKALFLQIPEILLTFLRTKSQRKANPPYKTIENRHALGVS